MFPSNVIATNLGSISFDELCNICDGVANPVALKERGRGQALDALIDCGPAP